MISDNAYEYVTHQRRRILFWGCWHVLVLTAFFVGLYYAYEYMGLPDRVIVVDKERNMGTAVSGPILCREVARDVAQRATHAFLNRSYEYTNEAACKAIFGKSAYEAVEAKIDESRRLFEERKIVQAVSIGKVEVKAASESDQCIVFVRGVLTRTGIYMDIPYFQRLKFTLGMRLMRSPDVEKYPLRVLRMQYKDEEIYETAEENIKGGNEKK